MRSFISLTLAVSAIFVSADPVTPIVNLGYATYEGMVNATTGNTEFLGMRFAAAPAGEYRWQAPRAPATVEGIQQAFVRPMSCFNAGEGIAPTAPFPGRSLFRRAAAVSSEDCLFLRYILPSNSAQEKLPVVVWIHGGGYMLGSTFGFSGEDLLGIANKGVVSVVIQYRLGLFGFLPGKEVKHSGVLNAGLLDQEFALKWVQTHISKFGGDPTKVTIWGESAGAGSVIQHVIANNGQTKPQLFRGAMTSSSFIPPQYRFDDVIPEAMYSDVVARANCSAADDTFACLRGTPAATLQNINIQMGDNAFFGTFAFVPVVDGTFITQRPTIALRQGKVNGQAVYAVTNTFEGAAFVNASTAPTVQVPDYVKNLFPNFGTKEIAASSTLYQGQGPPIDQVIGIMGESIFICPSYYLLRAFPKRSFKGEFALPPGGHGQDVPYYFTSTNGIPPFTNPDFKAFPQSFMNFVMALDPNVKYDPTNITPQWKSWDDEGNVEMLFNKTSDDLPVITPVRTSDELLDRCKFWESVGELTGQ
ncbi:Alpha/Beta hydrolase protein [Collybia nuda]|uniref:Carboxylic ester hydrolase n=1 Tax=Collybia nuda TaxID=64659 RepID=A0A9P6CNE0_9AGAR|nr:Alpha/Beta hydrolase protein [Collybia nuda]